MVAKKYLNGSILTILAAVLFIGFFNLVLAVEPSGGSVTQIRTETMQADAAGNNSAFAGNVTEIDVTGYSPTQAWQGYFGNVSGTIQLVDASDNVMYNWSLLEPSGEVYASTNSTIVWTNIQCFNFTANGTGGFAGETFGGTNVMGTNLSVLENRFGILSDDVDGVNETFAFTQGGDGHDLFYTANLQFSAGECLSTHIYDSSGASVNNHFEEALLYEPETSSVVFASILEEGTLNGFDSGDHDFEMLVLENGHGTDVSTTTYYFFLELE